MSVWRTDRKLGVTLYRDEVFVGHVCSATVAAEIVDALNGHRTVLIGLAELIERQCPEPDDVHAGGHCDYRHAAAMIRRYVEQPADAQRRSEATPQKDLPRDHIAGVTGCDCTMCRALDASRVDPYDTTKGGITE